MGMDWSHTSCVDILFCSISFFFQMLRLAARWHPLLPTPSVERPLVKFLHPDRGTWQERMLRDHGYWGTGALTRPIGGIVLWPRGNESWIADRGWKPYRPNCSIDWLARELLDLELPTEVESPTDPSCHGGVLLSLWIADRGWEPYRFGGHVCISSSCEYLYRWTVSARVTAGTDATGNDTSDEKGVPGKMPEKRMVYLWTSLPKWPGRLASI